MKSSPDHPVALITGASVRVGAVVARALHAAGYDLALHYRDSVSAAHALADELEQQRGHSTLLVQAELADVATLPPLVAKVIAHFGRLDALINNASTFYATPVGEITAAHWEELFNANARGPLFLSQAAAPHLRASNGAIINDSNPFGGNLLTNSVCKNTGFFTIKITF